MRAHPVSFNSSYRNRGVSNNTITYSKYYINEVSYSNSIGKNPAGATTEPKKTTIKTEEFILEQFTLPNFLFQPYNYGYHNNFMDFANESQLLKAAMSYKTIASLIYSPNSPKITISL
jgi:hypothetical protein